MDDVCNNSPAAYGLSGALNYLVEWSSKPSCVEIEKEHRLNYTSPHSPWCSSSLTHFEDTRESIKTYANVICVAFFMWFVIILNWFDELLFQRFKWKRRWFDTILMMWFDTILLFKNAITHGKSPLRRLQPLTIAYIWIFSYESLIKYV